jgi:hypothetical protein
MDNDDLIEFLETEVAQDHDHRHHPGFVMVNQNYYTPDEWAQMKVTAFGHRHISGLHVMSVSDERGDAVRTDPVAVGQRILSYGTVSVIVAVIVFIMVVIL